MLPPRPQAFRPGCLSTNSSSSCRAPLNVPSSPAPPSTPAAGCSFLSASPPGASSHWLLTHVLCPHSPDGRCARVQPHPVPLGSTVNQPAQPVSAAPPASGHPFLPVPAAVRPWFLSPRAPPNPGSHTAARDAPQLPRPRPLTLRASLTSSRNRPHRPPGPGLPAVPLVQGGPHRWGLREADGPARGGGGRLTAQHGSSPSRCPRPGGAG